jgi:hypothetical protein
LRTSHLALTVFFAAVCLEFGAVCLEARSQQTQLTNLGFLTCSLSEVAENQEETVAGPLRQTRDMLCAFKPGDGGPEETYTGTFQSVGRDQRGSVSWLMIWDVTGTPSMLGTPGFLQQIYFVDPAAAPGRATPLIGETNSSIVLETLAESQEQIGADERQPIISVLVALRLKSTPI